MARTKQMYRPIAIGDMLFNSIKSAQDYFKLSGPYLIQKGLENGVFNGMVCKYTTTPKTETKQVMMNRIHFKIGNVEYKAIKCAQKAFNLPDAKPIYQALIDGEFRGMPCVITQNCKPMAPDMEDTIVVKERQNGIRVRCEETGELYTSMADLYRIAKHMDCIKVPYNTFAHALRKYGTMKIDGETYTILDEKRKIKRYTRTLKPIEKIEEIDMNEVPLQPEVIDVEVKQQPIVLAHDTTEDLVIKQTVIDILKEKMITQVEGNQFGDAKNMLKCIEWVSKK